MDLGFPKHAIIAMIRRGDESITPNGSIKIEENDILIVLVDKIEVLDEVYMILGNK